MAEPSTGRALRLIGYWLGSDDPGWPDVNRFVGGDPDPAGRERVARYLSSGTSFVALAGHS